MATPLEKLTVAAELAREAYQEEKRFRRYKPSTEVPLGAAIGTLFDAELFLREDDARKEQRRKRSKGHLNNGKGLKP